MTKVTSKWVPFLVALLFAAQAVKAEVIHTGDKVVLELMQPGDEAEYVKLYADPLVRDTSNFDPGNTKYGFERAEYGSQIVREGAAKLAGLRKEHYDFKDLGLRIVDKATGKLVGFIVFDEMQIHGYWNTSTVIAPVYWNHGFGTEARAAADDFMFRKLEVPGLISVVSASNGPSNRVTEKLGFRYLGRIARRHQFKDDGDPKEYRLSRETYLKQPPPELKEQQVSPKTMESIDYAAKSEWIPEISKVSTYYRALMRDPLVRDRLSPEELSKLAEDLAYQLPGRDSKDAIDTLFLRLMLKKVQKDFGKQIRDKLGKDVTQLDLKLSEAQPMAVKADGTQERYFDLIAKLADGSEHLLQRLTFLDGTKDDYSSQWSKQMPEFKERLVEALKPAPPVADEGEAKEKVRGELEKIAQNKDAGAGDIGAKAAEIARVYLAQNGIPVTDIGFRVDKNGPVVFSIGAEPEPLEPYNPNNPVAQEMFAKIGGQEVSVGDILPRAIGGWGVGAEGATNIAMAMVSTVSSYRGEHPVMAPHSDAIRALAEWCAGKKM